MSGAPDEPSPQEDHADDRGKPASPTPVESDDMETGSPLEGPQGDPAEGKR